MMDEMAPSIAADRRLARWWTAVTVLALVATAAAVTLSSGNDWWLLLAMIGGGTVGISGFLAVGLFRLAREIERNCES